MRHIGTAVRRDKGWHARHADGCHRHVVSQFLEAAARPRARLMITTLYTRVRVVFAATGNEMCPPN